MVSVPALRIAGKGSVKASVSDAVLHVAMFESGCIGQTQFNQLGSYFAVENSAASKTKRSFKRNNKRQMIRGTT